MNQLFLRRRAKPLLLGFCLLCAALGLLLFPGEAMSAAEEGLLLCYHMIIPALFPFLVLSTLVVELGLAGYLGRAMEGVMRPLFNVPGACASALILGLVGGYPVGAKTAAALYRQGLCSKTEAERLLAFCNNSGPAFLLGVVGTGVFGSSRAGILLSLTHIAAALCVGLLFRFYRRGENGRADRRRAPQFEVKRFTLAFTDGVKSSFLSVLNICAFVVFFTVVIRLLFRSGLLPALAEFFGAVLAPFGFSALWVRRLFTGVLELSSGVSALTQGGSLAGRLTLAAFLLGWAGLSVHCQALSFLGDSGLSGRTYLLGKLLHGGLAAALTALATQLFLPDATVSAFFSAQATGRGPAQFGAVLSGAVTAAWAAALVLFLLAALLPGKSGGKRGKRVV